MADEADFASRNNELWLNRGIAAARGVLPSGRESAHECVECGADIPEGRRLALPGVQVCVRCAERRDIRLGAC